MILNGRFSGEACIISFLKKGSQIAKFMGLTWGSPGSCRPQMGPMLAPWTLLLGLISYALPDSLPGDIRSK